MSLARTHESTSSPSPALAPWRHSAATAVALLLALGAAAAGFALWPRSSEPPESVSYTFDDQTAAYTADAAAAYALEAFRAAIDSARPALALAGGDSQWPAAHAITYEILPAGGASRRRLTAGPCEELMATVRRYDVLARLPGATAATVRIPLDHALVPLFHFAVFYDDVLELHPGTALSINGRVHTNADMYLDAFTGLNLESFCTAAGRILHGKHPASREENYDGPVQIRDRGGLYRSMALADGVWLDHRHPDWRAAALTRWGGRVQDSAHGVTRLTLALAGGGAPRDIIRPAANGNIDSYELKAGLKIIDGAAFHRREDAWVDVTAQLEAAGVLRRAQFYDAREKRRVAALEIDIARLNAGSCRPANGIVYIHDGRRGPDLRAARLVNGTHLAAPLTVASDNPVYTRGDYNVIDPQPAAIIADAYTVLSNGWQDKHSAKSLEYRDAAGTTCNVSIIAGHVPTRAGVMSGGVHNLTRFLENWAGRTFHWRGAMAQLWESEYATGPWSDADGTYSPPARDWSYDDNLLDPAKLPPGTPLLNAIIWRAPESLAGQPPRSR
ncbi:MAG TPA: hypothetical protein VNN55_00060 [bacterium]|nr:hypothetical protein [bacterium]